MAEKIYILVEDVRENGRITTAAELFVRQLATTVSKKLISGWFDLETEFYSKLAGEFVEYVTPEKFDATKHAPCFYLLNFSDANVYPWAPLMLAVPDSTINLIRRHKLPIICSMSMEYWSTNDAAWGFDIERLYRHFNEYLELDSKVFFVTVGRASAVRQNICHGASHGTMAAVPLPLIGYWTRHEFGDAAPVSREDAYDFKRRTRLFLSMANCPRPNRVMLVNTLKQLNLARFGHVSYNQVGQLSALDMEDLASRTETAEGAQVAHALLKAQTDGTLISTPMTLDSPEHWNFSDASKYYLDSHFSIVNETYENDGFALVTEKTYKAILHRHPFMISAAPGALEYLRVMGYATYDGLFDETYDRFANILDRTGLIVNNVSRHVRELKRFESLMDRYRDVAEHNFHHFMDMDYGQMLSRTMIYWSHRLCNK